MTNGDPALENTSTSPLAGTVIYLSRKLPLEGGVYQWVKIGISPFAGFQSAWNYSFFLILMYATSGSVASSRCGASICPTSAATMMAITCPHQ